MMLRVLSLRNRVAGAASSPASQSASRSKVISSKRLGGLLAAPRAGGGGDDGPVVISSFLWEKSSPLRSFSQGVGSGEANATLDPPLARPSRFSPVVAPPP